jgi:hypothetical protein
MSRSLKKNKNISPHRKRLENIKDKSIFEEKEEKEDKKENILLSLIERVDELESDMEKKNIEIENLYSELTNLRYQIEKIEK